MLTGHENGRYAALLSAEPAEPTTTVCPACHAARPLRGDDPATFIEGALVELDGQVWLRRDCPRHGVTTSLYEEDAELWRARRGWGVPPLTTGPDREGACCDGLGCYIDGLPAAHGQHTCILVLNLTDRCNLACGTCYAAARPPGTPMPAVELPTIDDVLRTVRAAIDREGGQLDVLMLSGGEPTLRTDLPELLDRLVELPITRVMLNTNGRRIARDDRFVRLLERRRERLEVYLQLDGLRPETHLALRGEELLSEKLTALRRLDQARVFTTLVMTVVRGVNEDELGEVVGLGLNTPHCSGLAVQPAFGSGRGGVDPHDRVTPTGVLCRLGGLTGGRLAAHDFIPLPCSHPDCCDLAYLIRGADEQWVSLISLMGRERMRDWLPLIGNTITFQDLSPPVMEMLRNGSLDRLLSEQTAGTPQVGRDLQRVCRCVAGVGRLLGGLWRRAAREEALLERVAERTFRVTVKMFMDAHTFHEARIRQCCVHSGTFEAEPRRYSFCWRWLFADATDRPAVAGFVPLAMLEGT
ncbi:MAG: radical SAM protein [Armatimonadetes bacterium]|nr:radical SAM protein [Armatimonadota bacterium]